MVSFLTFNGNGTSLVVKRTTFGCANKYVLAWSVGFINFPLLVEEVERRPIVSVNLLHLRYHNNVSQNGPFRRIYNLCVFKFI